nr:helix-turn-helix transcriptional regulator [uncultured Chryseobacterium sp.]
MRYEKLIFTRRLKGFTQKNLAQQIAMEQTTLSRKERGLSPISDEEWQRIAAVLKVSVDEIRETKNKNYSQNLDQIVKSYKEPQYITMPKDILESLLKSKDDQIATLKELLKNK